MMFRYYSNGQHKSLDLQIPSLLLLISLFRVFKFIMITQTTTNDIICLLKYSGAAMQDNKYKHNLNHMPFEMQNQRKA